MIERRSIFTRPAGPRAKWAVFAIWVVGIMIAAGPANLPGQFTDAEENESTSFLPGDAESTKALQAAEELQGGELAPAVIVYRREAGLTAGRPRADRPGRPAPDRAALPRRRCRRRHRRGGRAGRRLAGGSRRRGRPGAGGRRHRAARRLRRSHHAHPGPARRLRALRRADLLRGRQGGDRHRLPEGRGRRRQDPRSGRVLARHGVRPGRRPRGEDHGRRRIRGGRHRGLREHQRHAAAGRGVAGDRAADPHLPLADLPVHPARGGDLRRDPGALRGLRALRARRHDQRPVQRDHVDPGAWRGHRLRAPDRGEIPRGAAPHVGPPRGHPGGDDLRRARRVRLCCHRDCRSPLPQHRPGQRHLGTGPDRRHGRGLRRDLHAHAAAGAAHDLRPARVLAVRAAHAAVVGSRPAAGRRTRTKDRGGFDASGRCCR